MRIFYYFFKYSDLKGLIMVSLLCLAFSITNIVLTNANSMPSNRFNNFQHLLEWADGLELFKNNGLMQNAKKYGEWARANVCNQRNDHFDGPLDQFIGTFCAAGDDWRNAKRNLMQTFGGEKRLIESVTKGADKILEKLQSDEAKASEKERMAVSNAIRQSLKKITEKMPAETNLEAFYARHKQNGETEHWLGSALFGVIVKQLWPALIDEIVGSSRKGEEKAENTVGSHPKSNRKRRHLDTLVLMLALLVGAAFVTGLTIAALRLVFQQLLGPFFVMCCFVAIIFILLVQLV